MECQKCGHKNKKKAKFCMSCGTKLEKVKKEIKEKKKHEISKEHQKNINPHLIPWAIFSIVLIIAGILLLPTKVVGYQVEVPYIDTEQYTVDIPYEDIESKVVQVPYETTEEYVERVPVQEQVETIEEVYNDIQLKYKVEIVKCKSGSFWSDGEATYQLTNLDDTAGTFVIKIGYRNSPSGELIGSSSSKYISALSSATLTFTPIPDSAYSCGYQPITIPTKKVKSLEKSYKTVTNYKDVVKTKTVTKYRDETQYDKVTKTRTETREKEVRKTKTETKYKEINWIFGFSAIIKFRNLEQ